MEPHDESFKLSEQSFRKILDREVFPAGAFIFQQGQTAGKAYILLRGEIDIVMQNAAGQTIVLTKVQKGQFFGELALLMNSTRTAAAVARTECEVLYIARDKLTQKLQEADPFLRYWIQYLSGRVVDLSKRVQKTSG